MCACIKPDSIFVTVVLQKDLENLLLKLDLNPKGLAPILDELGVENVKVWYQEAFPSTASQKWFANQLGQELKLVSESDLQSLNLKVVHRKQMLLLLQAVKVSRSFTIK